MKKSSISENVTFKKGDSVYYCRPDLHDFTASKGIIDRIEGENAFIEGIDVPIPLDVIQHIIPEVEPKILPLNKDYKLASIFDADFLDSLGYKLMELGGSCGVAVSKHPKGKKIIYFNFESYRCDYFGKPLPENVAVGIKDDWDTRTSFNGCVYNREHLKTILELTH